MSWKKYNTSLVGLFALLAIAFLPSCGEWEEPEPPTLVSSDYLLASATSKLNGGEWDAHCAIYIYKDLINLNFISEYQKGVGRSMWFQTILNPGKTLTTSLDSGTNGYLHHRFQIVDVDVAAGNWFISDSLPEYNYIAIDSINSDTSYVKGRFSANFKHNGGSDFWRGVNDPLLDEWIEIREGTFEGRVYSKR
ncbi:MAG: hypothetical protein ACJA19_000944 [Bacteroidia bacterium]|jgi:hypothetical protein|tara:strand:+ start:2319 stop:2897 length:579 start_codon:yes stop_codon:yes gene_type:complete